MRSAEDDRPWSVLLAYAMLQNVRLRTCYKKQREGSRVKSVYVGRGHIANMVAQIQSTSRLLENVARANKSPEVIQEETAEASLKNATDLIQLVTEGALLPTGFHQHHRQWRRKRLVARKSSMTVTHEAGDNSDKVRERFHSLLTKANKERPRAADIQDLKDLLYSNKGTELWKAVIGMGELAESQVLDTIVNGSGQGMRECWRQRLQAIRADLGIAEASALERLLIQQVTLCWLNLTLAEYRFTNVTKQSISFACGLYWEKRLSAAQRRFTRACETLARVRRLSRNTPALQFNIAASGGQQVNLTK